MITFRNKISQGSLLTYDGVLGTLSSMEFISDADIGMALKDGSTATWTGAVTSTKVIIIPIKPTADTTLILDDGTTKLAISGGSIIGDGATLTNCYIAEYRNSLLDTNTVTLNKWQLIIAEFNSGITFGTNVKYSLTANCQMGEVIMLDAIPGSYTSYHRWFNNLTRKGLKKANLLDQYLFNHKSTDLSNEDDLAAAFTFKLGSTDDVSGNGNHATNNGATPTIRGMKLDGVDDEMTLSSHPLNSYMNSSVSCRIIPYGNSTNGCVFGSGGIGYVIDIKSTRIHIYGYDGHNRNIYSDSQITFGKEYTVTLTTDNDGLTKMYVNGALQSSTFTFSSSPSLTTPKIGSQSSNFFYGEIDDVRLYNKVLTTQQVKDYHNSFLFPTILDKGIGDAVGNAPNEWIKGTTGALTVEEVTSGTLPVGTKYIKLSSIGTCYINNSDMVSLVDNGYADYWALISGTWTHRQGLVSAMTELSYANDKLTYTTANANDGFAINGQYSFLIKAGATV